MRLPSDEGRADPPIGHYALRPAPVAVRDRVSLLTWDAHAITTIDGAEARQEVVPWYDGAGPPDLGYIAGARTRPAGSDGSGHDVRWLTKSSYKRPRVVLRKRSQIQRAHVGAGEAVLMQAGQQQRR